MNESDVGGSMNSEQLQKFNHSLEQFDMFRKHNLQYLIAMAAISVAAAYHGGKGALAKHILQQHREMCRDLSPEEIAEIEAMERREAEALLADYTPDLTQSPFFRMPDDLASWLLGAAMESDEKFDEVFEEIMIHRYGKKIVRLDGEQQVVYSKAESVDDLDCIITGYKE